jgi:hypothetical protein
MQVLAVAVMLQIKGGLVIPIVLIRKVLSKCYRFVVTAYALALESNFLSVADTFITTTFSFTLAAMFISSPLHARPNHPRVAMIMLYTACHEKIQASLSSSRPLESCVDWLVRRTDR